VFSATIDIDAQGRYSALGSAALDLPTAIDEAEIDFEVIPGTEEAEITEENASAVSEAGEAQGTGTIDASSGKGSPGAADVEDRETAEVTAAQSVGGESVAPSEDSLRGTLLIVGAILLVGAMSAWFFMSRREKRSKDSERRDAEVDA
jgi:cobalamin biosynthesis Mg chelatase CobN